MAHGFGAERTFGLEPFAERFARAGLAAFLFDYRCFGDRGTLITETQALLVRRRFPQTLSFGCLGPPSEIVDKTGKLLLQRGPASS
jgi:hypothetical protein